MPRYRVHRMKESPRETFRWAAHTGGLAIVKPKDYEAGAHIDAPTPYAAWTLLANSGEALAVGDLLEHLDEAGNTLDLRIAKYIGFESAQWFIPGPKPEPGSGLTEPSAPLEAANLAI